MKYIALTIGPIYKTLSSAKKTQELWASSYLFSYVMKEIIRGFTDKAFVVPYIGGDTMQESSPIGLFHDRFIFRSDGGDLTRLQSHIDTVLGEIAQKLFYKKGDERIYLSREYLAQYLQIHYDEYEVAENPILEISPYLDTQELQYQVAPDGDNLIQKALKEKNNFLKKLHFDSRPFPSLPEIALADSITPAMRHYLHREPAPEISLYENSEFNAELKPYHKYVAIVHADGDNMSKVIKALQEGEFSDFSQRLFNYCSESADRIKIYGGETIFAGGDDLLFFAPVYNMSTNQSIFGLIDEITKVFDGAFEGYNTLLAENGVRQRATLSFGVRIVYYKYPLYEALAESRDLLFDIAKETGDKNNIAFSFSKHAGQTFGAVITKDTTGGDLYEHFTSLIMQMTDIENAGNFLGSLHHKIESYQVLLFEACRYRDKTRVQNFFVNFFKKEHRQYREFFDQMVSYIYAVGNLDIDKVEKLKQIYAPLKYIKHIQGDRS